MPVDQETLYELLDGLCNGTITPDEHRRLGEFLAEDPAARRFYFDYLDLHLLLSQWRQTTAADEIHQRATPSESQTSPLPSEAVFLPSPFGRGAGGESGVPEIAPPESLVSIPHSVLRTPYSSLSAFLPTTPLGNVAFSYAMSALLVGIGLFSFSLMSASSPSDTVVKNKPSASQNYTVPNVPSPAPEPEPEIVSVGRITGMVDCQWVDANDAPFHDRVVLGTKYMLKSGLLEITYKTGAKVILQGPCTYKAESAAGGFLSLGKVTARVESRSRMPDGTSRSRLPSGTLPTDHDTSESRPAGGTYFSVRTPTAVVTDLGTEFGVEVSKNGDTKSHVYQGRVELRISVGAEKGNGQVIPLGEGESARVTIDEAKVVKVIRDKGASLPNSFARSMPKRIPIKLFNTGIGLKEGDPDPHWQIIARSDDPKFKPRPAIVRHPYPSWFRGESCRWLWISLVGDDSELPNNVTFTFRTTFDLIDVYPNTARLSGWFLVDNHIQAIRLNGHGLVVPKHEYNKAMHEFCKFTIDHGFVEGSNQLEVEVENRDIIDLQSLSSPMGVVIDMEGSVVSKATAAPVAGNNSR